MNWVVVLIETDRADVKVFGPYPSVHEAEAARRRVHFSAMSACPGHARYPGRVPQTFKRPINSVEPQ